MTPEFSEGWLGSSWRDLFGHLQRTDLMSPFVVYPTAIWLGLTALGVAWYLGVSESRHSVEVSGDELLP